ncbi:uncharacterized protein LOC110810441 isoform X2 [Carica papaya]|uniref:uncharacterized protein LOC110810441 isoform X2 n=1 Tax=Carica papaya TaxID=3649 RepID=UPI000B8C848A|nr:uncharacterized protein LOC110810441 isoform X2 [Carica papaya]
MGIFLTNALVYSIFHFGSHKCLFHCILTRLLTSFTRSGKILFTKKEKSIQMINVHAFCKIQKKHGHSMILPPQNILQSALEEELEKVRRSVDNLQTKLRVGLEIENHLKKKVHELEKKNILAEKLITNGIADLRNFHSAQSAHIMNLLGEGRSFIELTIDTLQEIFRHCDVKRRNNLEHARHDVKQDEYECGNVHIHKDEEVKGDGSVAPTDVPDKKGDASEALAQALQEKVAALLLLSQQEERHLLERNVNAALQKKIEELQRNLLQVTNEKVKALVELARLKQEYELLQEKTIDELKQGKADISEKRSVAHERDGKLRNLLKKTYLNRWVGPLSLTANVVDPHLNDERNFSGRRSSSTDYARMKIENVALKETMESMEYLTTTIHRLRLELLRVKESVSSGDTLTSMSAALSDITTEANLVKTALGSSLPVRWSADSDTGSISDNMGKVQGIGNSTSERIDSVSAAGLEMVELLILAAQLLKNGMTKISTQSEE